MFKKIGALKKTALNRGCVLNLRALNWGLTILLYFVPFIITPLSFLKMTMPPKSEDTLLHTHPPLLEPAEKDDIPPPPPPPPPPPRIVPPAPPRLEAAPAKMASDMKNILQSVIKTKSDAIESRMTALIYQAPIRITNQAKGISHQTHVPSTTQYPEVSSDEVTHKHLNPLFNSNIENFEMETKLKKICFDLKLRGDSEKDVIEQNLREQGHELRLRGGDKQYVMSRNHSSEEGSIPLLPKGYEPSEWIWDGVCWIGEQKGNDSDRRQDTQLLPQFAQSGKYSHLNNLQDSPEETNNPKLGVQLIKSFDLCIQNFNEQHHLPKSKDPRSRDSSPPRKRQGSIPLERSSKCARLAGTDKNRRRHISRDHFRNTVDNPNRDLWRLEWNTRSESSDHPLDTINNSESSECNKTSGYIKRDQNFISKYSNNTWPSLSRGGSAEHCCRPSTSAVVRFDHRSRSLERPHHAMHDAFHNENLLRRGEVSGPPLDHRKQTFDLNSLRNDLQPYSGIYKSDKPWIHYDNEYSDEELAEAQKNELNTQSLQSIANDADKKYQLLKAEYEGMKIENTGIKMENNKLKDLLENGKKDIKAKEKEMQALRNELDSHNAQTVVSELKERHRVQLRDLRSEIEKKSDEAAKVKLEELRNEKDDVIAKIGAEYQTNLQKLEHGSQERLGEVDEAYSKLQARLEVLSHEVQAKDQQIKEEQETGLMFKSEGEREIKSVNMKFQEELDQLRISSRHTEDQLAAKVERLESRKGELEAALTKYTSSLESGGPSTPTFSSMDTTSSVLVMQDQISTLEMTVRQREEEIKRLSEERGTPGPSTASTASTAASSAPTDLRCAKVAMNQFTKGDIVLLYYNEEKNNYLLANHRAEDYLYFVHPDNLASLGLSLQPPQKPWCLAQIRDKEFCQARKVNNRFKVQEGTKFYRVYAYPYNVGVTAPRGPTPASS